MNCAFCKLEVYLPTEYAGQLMKALAEIGVGRVGDYDHCFSTTEVKGFWRPLDGADPFRGELGKLGSAPELKLETRLEAKLLEAALETIRKVHPYEEPVINILPLLS
ncbi:MAG: cytochrome C biogenesis protein [Bacillota bacterium]|jgi:hypothetical protein|nr:cytochrome C biogenesis protein [Bacillota bacterium]HHT91793.1 cytochrome C biogenesis protein [Bacillota bacterium]